MCILCFESASAVETDAARLKLREAGEEANDLMDGSECNTGAVEMTNVLECAGMPEERGMDDLEIDMLETELSEIWSKRRKVKTREGGGWI